MVMFVANFVAKSVNIPSSLRTLQVSAAVPSPRPALAGFWGSTRFKAGLVRLSGAVTGSRPAFAVFLASCPVQGRPSQAFWDCVVPVLEDTANNSSLMDTDNAAVLYNEPKRTYSS